MPAVELYRPLLTIAGNVRWLDINGVLHSEQGKAGSVMIGTAADVKQRRQLGAELDEARIRIEATLSGRRRKLDLGYSE